VNKKQAEEFLSRGFTVVRGGFPAKTAARYVTQAYERIGCDPADPSTWKEKRVHAQPENQFAPPDFAPKAWKAICELVGGEDRIHEPDNPRWQDAFIIKFPHGKGHARQVPGPGSPHSWHMDGGPDMRHFLDSGEIGLITLALWSAVKPKGGGTLLACDSVPRVARHLAEHPEGMVLREGGMERRLMEGCSDFFEFTGGPGDVLLAHPFLIHAESDNVAGPPRFQTVGFVPLKERMRFDRRPANKLSLVERAILRALDKTSFSFARR